MKANPKQYQKQIATIKSLRNVMDARTTETTGQNTHIAEE